MIVWDATAKNYNQQGQGHSLLTYPAMHHIRVQALRQGHTANACLRLGTEGEYLCLELLAVFTPGVEQVLSQHMLRRCQIFWRRTIQCFRH